MTNYDILKEYEAHKTPVPSYEELQALKEENARLKKWLEFIATMQWGDLKDCQKYARQALDGSEM